MLPWQPFDVVYFIHQKFNADATPISFKMEYYTLTWCNTNLHVFWSVLYWPVIEENRVKSLFFQTHISTKPRKPRPPIMACTKYNAFWENEWSRFLKIHFTFIVTRGWRKLNSVAFQWNHKIYLSRHYQTPIFSNYSYPAIVSHPLPPPPSVRPNNYPRVGVASKKYRIEPDCICTMQQEAGKTRHWLEFHLPLPLVQPWDILAFHYDTAKTR